VRIKISVSRLEQAVSELQNEERITLYLNEGRVKRAYDRIGEGDQLTLIDQFTRGGEAGILGWFKAQLSNTRGHQALIQVNEKPELMAIMVETHFRISGQLLELPDETFRRDARLIKYVGESHITENDQEVTAETTGLSDALAQVVKEERDRQVDRQKKWKAEDPSMLVWTTAGQPALASIASWEVVNKTEDLYNWYSGYHLRNPLGITGSREEEKSGIVFITPLWIWYQALSN
jgi:hypothetical protein